MTKLVPCPSAPGPLEDYTARFDDLFSHLGQRRGFRKYLTGLLAPRERNKTLTALAGAEPVVGAQHAAVQRLQYFLSESCWDHERINARRLEILRADPATAPHAAGVLIIDDSGDRKDGTATAHVGHQWLGRYGKTDRGIVTVTTLWADERVYYPVHAQPYTPAKHFPHGRNDPAFRTKLAIGAELARQAGRAGFAFRAVTADCAYGDQDGFRGELRTAGLPFVMALKPRHGTWGYQDAYTPVDAAREVTGAGPDDPGDWVQVRRTFRDGHTECWWAADARLGWWGPDGTTRLVVATLDPGLLPDKATWYLATNLPRPGGPREADSPHPAADLAEIVRIYGIRHWIEQSYKQVKDELGWADFQVRSDVAIRRHQSLVNCAFSFCWQVWFTDPSPPGPSSDPSVERGCHQPIPAATDAPPSPRHTRPTPPKLALRAARRASLAGPSDHARALVAGMVHRAPTR
ncbi:IS701 family transposase [Streptosporangium sp. NBC_01495]|uniref:IS701 family transposase n=1 Tax=Streptosporangium sp. NBC_01495 TaxID=2903899 RepID=UPI002E32BAB7|nr:IS701 family transposase [Streptosporangium sp. NBC_01495]